MKRHQIVVLSAMFVMVIGGLTVSANEEFALWVRWTCALIWFGSFLAFMGLLIAWAGKR